MRSDDVRRAAAAGLLLALAAAGCSGGGPNMKPVFPVRGTVTHKGQPAAGAQLNFVPADAGGPGATFATGVVAGDGTFELSTYRQKDGAPAGEYAVTVYWPDNRAGAKKVRAAAGEELAPDRLNGAYSNPKTTALKATVREQDNTLTLDIP